METKRIYHSDMSPGPQEFIGFGNKISYANRLITKETNSQIRERLCEYISDVKAEPKISKDMQNIVSEIGSELLGFEHRIKDCTKARFYEKISQSRIRGTETIFAIL